ncbi:uncharacterized protein TNCV_1548131 [Trichonephila clavipes]|nr:uncharacterized protein TNCV_1548131 [Trichonephila clavipes]
MDICQCIVSSQHRALNSHRAASSLVRLVEGEEMLNSPDHPQSILTQNEGETELNRPVTCLVLKATANDRRPLAMMNYVGLDLVFAIQVALDEIKLI